MLGIICKTLKKERLQIGTRAKFGPTRSKRITGEVINNS